jgi:hypothetical protein
MNVLPDEFYRKRNIIADNDVPRFRQRTSTTKTRPTHSPQWFFLKRLTQPATVTETQLKHELSSVLSVQSMSLESVPGADNQQH